MAIEADREAIRSVQRRAAEKEEMDSTFAERVARVMGKPETTDDLLATRGKTHGDFTNHAGCTQELKDCVHKWLSRSGKSWHELPNEIRESLDMILHKIGRIVAGDAAHADHWDDIAGYAKLVPPRVTPTEDPGICWHTRQDDDDGA